MINSATSTYDDSNNFEAGRAEYSRADTSASNRAYRAQIDVCKQPRPSFQYVAASAFGLLVRGHVQIDSDSQCNCLSYFLPAVSLYSQAIVAVGRNALILLFLAAIVGMATPDFVRVAPDGRGFTLRGSPFYFCGANCYYVMVRRDKRWVCALVARSQSAGAWSSAQ